jgi:hypothetical protein
LKEFDYPEGYEVPITQILVTEPRAFGVHHDVLVLCLTVLLLWGAMGKDWRAVPVALVLCLVAYIADRYDPIFLRNLSSLLREKDYYDHS